MNDMLLFDAPKQRASIIKVIGVGGGGSNAVTHMYKQGIKGVDFVICNTDSQAMDISAVPNKIQLGKTGLGAGSIPDVGRLSAEENIEEIKKIIESNTKMLFVTAGMGGGIGITASTLLNKEDLRKSLPNRRPSNLPSSRFFLYLKLWIICCTRPPLE
jgi:cell division protein FtsZ